MRRILDLYSPAAQVHADLERGPCLGPFLLDVLWQVDGEGMETFVYRHLHPFDKLSNLCRKAIYRHLATAEDVFVAPFEDDGV